MAHMCKEEFSVAVWPLAAIAFQVRCAAPWSSLEPAWRNGALFVIWWPLMIQSLSGWTCWQCGLGMTS